MAEIFKVEVISDDDRCCELSLPVGDHVMLDTYQRLGQSTESPFQWSLLQCKGYVRQLKLMGVGVQFEKEGINTLALGDEMLLNTFSAIAQEESKAISQNQRLSIVKRMEMGEYVDSNAPYGFRLVDKELVVYEPEAEIVRWIYKLNKK